MSQTMRPVSEPAPPDGFFGYQIPPPAPMFMGSQLIVNFEQDHISRKVSHSARSAESKALGTTTRAPSGPDPCPTHGMHPLQSGLRSNTPARPSHHVSHVLPQSYVEHQ
ncbi:hypothetical protein JVT61DRAFT_1517 [Boletus reticuloceps]|uniref:Uncharacterized protein n=1 Tax=Boletus reticuloceps TaxID=495285 RepID=A0A8I2YBY4_9AGAM|nr:hypothetical protein JVT61DRAFT_1517 [Boletus reticuloceps]